MPDTRSPAPSWDLESIGPPPGTPEFGREEEAARSTLTRLGALFDTHDVRDGDPLPADAATAAVVTDVLAGLDDATAVVRRLRAVTHGHVTGDARDDGAAAADARLRTQLTAPLNVLSTRFAAWCGRLDVEALSRLDVTIQDHAHPLRRAAAAARHQMTEGEEDLAAALGLVGGASWVRLHGDITGRLTGTLESSSRRGEIISMPSLRALATDPDPQVRRAAFEAEQVAWESVAVPLAACLNSQKGEAQILNERRGWPDDLEPALFDNGIERSSLEAMTAEVVDALGDFGRYVAAKARLLGHDGRLPWWDLLAPAAASVSAHGGRIGWDDGVARVRESFAGYDLSLAALVDRAVEDRWIDAAPRDGKRGGAFCMPVADDVSRILMTYDGSADAVQTLAHELGHAYHNTMLGQRTWLQRATPRCLAETASIFCETLVVDALLADAAPAERLALLDTDLSGATQVVVDIHSRYLFESGLYERRRDTTLSVSELCELMTDCQRRAYGEAVSPTHPWMWAVKPHYFTPFYNFPYTFGLLFGLGLFARYQEDPRRFRGAYDDLLAATGLDTARELGLRFGIDIDDRGFWRSSLDVLRSRIDEFCTLATS